MITSKALFNLRWLKKSKQRYREEKCRFQCSPRKVLQNHNYVMPSNHSPKSKQDIQCCWTILVSSPQLTSVPSMNMIILQLLFLLIPYKLCSFVTPSWYICLCSEIVEAIREELSYFLSTKSPNVYAHVPTLYLFFLLKWQCVLAPIRKMSLFELGIPSLLSEGNLSSVSIPFTWSVSLFLSLSHSHKPKTIFQNFSVETQ